MKVLAIIALSLVSTTSLLPSFKPTNYFTNRFSTPFEADLYDNPYEDDDGIVPTTAVDPDTPLIIGVNKYSHDTSICAANAVTGKVLFAISKERLSRRKHDAGNIATCIEACLEALDLDLQNIQRVVVNNHHHRVLPMESNIRHMEWEAGLNINGGAEDGYDEPENLLPDAEHRELSHHLAHAYSAACQAPFESGMVVIMDGMGETFRAMLRAKQTNDSSYVSDLNFGLDTFTCVPSDILQQVATAYFDFREAESVYTYTKTETSVDLKPIFKRFTRENSSPTLYNHGFENMDSVGALYSRASSHIFGDWNACGKVMGLAPWATHKWTDENGYQFGPKLHDEPIMSGCLYKDDGLIIDRTLMEGLPHIARNDPDLFLENGVRRKRYDFDGDDYSDGVAKGKRVPVNVALEAIALSHRIQTDLENVVIDFVSHFKKETGMSNLCLAGGVALNSVLNGRLSRELGFNETFIPPYPGDDGIAFGCCAFGLYGNVQLDKDKVGRIPIWKGPLTPYLGPGPSETEIKAAIEIASPWLQVETIRDESRKLRFMAEEVASGGVVAWYRSRSEMGPRALGHRSILADPRKKDLVRFINEHVKSRESFRPFAPSVLADHASEWFHLGEGTGHPNVSPYMSITALVRDGKRDIIPAVTHVDGSSRLQTVTVEDEPVYYNFISAFMQLTGIPMVLNTSFNTVPGEPIVESPSNAIRSFLYSMGAIEMLVMGDYVIKRKEPDPRKLLGEVTKGGVLRTEPAYPKRTGPATFHTSLDIDPDILQDDEDVRPVSKVRMPLRPMHHNRNEWFELLDDLEGTLLSLCDGKTTVNDMMAEFTETDKPLEKEDFDNAQALLQNIVHRLVRLYEHTLISW